MKKILFLLVLASVMLAGCKYFTKHNIGPMPKKARFHKVVFYDSIPPTVKLSGPTRVTLEDEDEKISRKIASVEEESDEFEDVLTNSSFIEGETTVKRSPASAVLSKSTASIIPLNTTLVVTSIERGKIVYHIPDTMISFKDYEVIVRISNPKDTNITNGIINPIIANIRISSRMEVKLKNGQPDSTFQIRTINDGIQIIDSISYTEWKFSVKPLKSGTGSLVLVVSIISGTDVKQTVYTDNVKIVSNPIGWWKRFWSSEYKWLFSTFLIPIFIYFWKNKNKKDEQN